MVRKHGGQRHAHVAQYCHVTFKYFMMKNCSDILLLESLTSLKLHGKRRSEPKMFKVDEDVNRESKKPNHVRRLNFGQSILTLDRIERYQGQRDGALWFNGNLANIPCTAKDDLVRKWIESYDNNVFDRNEKPGLSPVQGLSSTRAVQTSPIFGMQRRKRDKQKGTVPLAVRDAKKGRSNESANKILEEIPSFPADNDKCLKVCDDHRKGNVKRNLFESPSITVPSSVPTLASVSPVLLRNSYSCGRRQRKFHGRYSQRRLLDCFESKCIEINTKSPSVCTKACAKEQSPILGREFRCYKGKRGKQGTKKNVGILDGAKNSYIDSNMNFVPSPCSIHLKDLNHKTNMSCTQKRCALLEELGTDFKGDNVNSLLCEDSKISEESVRSHSSLSKAKLKIEDSPRGSVKDPVKIGIQFSNEDDNDSLTDIKDINNDTGEDFSDHIEVVDTQDLVGLVVANNHILADDSTAYIRPKSVMLRPQTADIESDRTFFSEAEQFRCTTLSVQSSSKISHISSQVTDNRDSRSSQTGIIVSTGTSPCKASTNLTVQLPIMMDSGKKRRKPKRGSLMEKLQSAINRRLSFVRTWKHQLKQTVKQHTCVPCVTILVRRCTIRFGRQFLEGAALEDRFSLLPPKGTAKSNKCLTIMTIPEVTGKTDTKSEGLIQIFPPWETLDAEKMVLNVTYIQTIPNDEIVARQLKLNICQINKRSIFEEFHCPCIGLNKMVPFCKNWTNKPNVMAKLAH